MARVSLHGVRRVHSDGTAALSGVDLVADPGEMVGVIGPSGSGKSTLLRVVAGLERVSDGLVRIGDRDVTSLAVARRRVAMVVDQPGLASLLDALGDMLPGADDASPPGRAHERRRTPRPRVAPGLSGLPEVVLADDPLRMADPAAQRAMRARLRRLQSRGGLTTLVAANDHSQVLGIADRIVVLRDGRVVQDDPPATLLARPRTRWVAGFVGTAPMSFVEAVVRDEGGIGWLQIGTQRLRMPGGLPGPLRDRAGTTVVLGARPDVVHATEMGDRADLRLDADVVQVSHLGGEDRVEVSLGTGTWTARFPAGSGAVRGARVEVTVDARALSAFDPVDGTAVWHGR